MGRNSPWLAGALTELAQVATIEEQFLPDGAAWWLRLRIVPKWRNWQKRMVQVHVPARVWGFESLLRHHHFSGPHNGPLARRSTEREAHLQRRINSDHRFRLALPA